MKYQPCGKLAKNDPHKSSRLLLGPKQVKRPKTLQRIIMMMMVIMMMIMMVVIKST
jgi:hypothetical protein